jgi:transglutaminase-like putative cysteine protease
MAEVKRSILFGKLNPLAYKALESATSFCKLRGNPYVELVHWLQQILQTPDSDVIRIIKHFGIDASRLAADIVAALGRLPRGATSISNFSPHLEQAVERGWVYGSLLFAENRVRTGHIVVGLVKTTRLSEVFTGISREFARIEPETLTDHFAKIVAGSPEGELAELPAPAPSARPTLQICYKVEYSYSRPVSFSPQLVRLIPRLDTNVFLRSVQLQTNDGSSVMMRRDMFDNPYAFVFLPGESDHLVFDLQIEVDVAHRNPFAFLLEPHASEIPFAYKPEEKRALTIYLDQRNPAIALPFWNAYQKQPTVQTLLALMKSFEVEIDHDFEGLTPRTPQQTLQERKGSTLDKCELLSDVMCNAGIASRIVSGFIAFSTSPTSAIEPLLGAWIEVYLPGAGWVGLDPSNAILADHRHIATAVGLTRSDVTILSGNYHTREPVEGTSSSQLSIKRIGL